MVHFLLFILLVFQAQASNICSDWLSKTKAVPGNKDCELICSIADTDMATYTCPMQCETYCTPKCKLDPFWQKVLATNAEPFKPLSGVEKDQVSSALTTLPKSFKPKSLKAIGRATKHDLLSPSNPATSTDEFIILFPKMFTKDYDISRVLFHEIIHQLIQNEWSQQFSSYKKNTGWDKVDEGNSRTGDFVDPDGKLSAEEDFANNIEYFVFDPEKLRKTSPKIFDWINLNLKSQIQTEKGCNEKPN